LHLTRLLAGGALTLLAALFATSGCTTVVAPEPPGGGGGYDGGTGSSSSGGDGSSGSSSGSLDAAVCMPGDVTTYSPQYHPATGAYLAMCTDNEVMGFYDGCLGPNASTNRCNQFMNSDASSNCAACILTPDSAKSYGPLIGHGSFVTANVAGCMELTDATTSGLACAKAVQALGGCELLACVANCDVHDGTSLDAYEKCASAADQAGCATYASASSCVQSLEEAGDGVAQCLAQDFATFYYLAAHLFCGMAPAMDAGAPPDAGSPPPDGSTASD
jgi:hypothetical protein